MHAETAVVEGIDTLFPRRDDRHLMASGHEVAGQASNVTSEPALVGRICVADLKYTHALSDD
jgi:hypothetical protein